ncbi:benzoate/H(+) symporter BenE family transporter [Peribacillus saganii]|nr:benzoate/H(+) symporter BenE family transporter [Peribacillus saganii]
MGQMEYQHKYQENKTGFMTKRKFNRSNPLRDITGKNLSSGLIASTLILTGPALIVLEAAASGHFTTEQTINWMFAVYFFGGLFGILMALWFKIPITGGHSISGVAFLATMTSQFSYSQLIGGYVMSGIFILLVGLTGVFTKIIKWVPKEVIASMLAGLVTGYVVKLVPAIKEMPLVGGLALISFFLVTRYSKRIPAVMAAVTVAFLTLLFSRNLDISSGGIPFIFPSLQMPEFTWMGMLTLGIPLAMLVLSNDVAPGVGALESSDFNPPIRKIVSISGVFSVTTSFFGGQCANIAGMMTAICAGQDSGPREKRYMGSFVSGVVLLIFGVFAWKVVPFIQSLPQAFVSLLGGFALISVLHSSLQKGFSGNQYPLSALTAFIVSISNVSFFHISAPVWALVFGAIVARTVEK